MTQIKNKLYVQFLREKGEIKIINEDDINLVLESIKTKHRLEARALVICLYYTGARPNEVLRLKSSDVVRDGRYINVRVVGSKRGLTRKLRLPIKLNLVKEFYRYVEGTPPEKLLFFNFIGNYERVRYKKNGSISRRKETSDKLRYHINKWFSVLPETITTYYLRHSRFSQLAEAGLSLQELKFWKGSRTVESIQPYLHMSARTSKTIGRALK